MLPVTTQYNDAVYATSRKSDVKVLFQIVDNTAQPDATPSSTIEAEVSKISQIVDNLTAPSFKYATFETDYWSLDGSFVLTPKATESLGNEIGFWSNNLSDSDMSTTFVTYVKVDFSTYHSCGGITIYFDTLNDEYATFFEIAVYRDGGLTYFNNVTGNTEAKYVWQRTLTNFDEIRVYINYWKTPDRRVRISEIVFGLAEEYTSTELVRMSVLEEIDTMSNQVTSNEMSFTIDNLDKRFNILNPEGVYASLKKNQKIRPYIGIEKADTTVEFLPMGVYYLQEWKSDTGSLTATFTARDRLDQLSQFQYGGISAEGLDAWTFFANILYNFAGIPFAEFAVSDGLYTELVTGTLPVMSCRDALQYLAIATKSIVYCDRYGVLWMKQLDSVSTGHAIDFDNIYEAPEIIQDKLVNTIIVDVLGTPYTYTDPLKLSTDEVFSVNLTNPLITTNAKALEVATWLMLEYNKRYLYSINFRGNAAIEAGDILTIEDEFGVNGSARVTRQDFIIEGALSCRVNAKGG